MVGLALASSMTASARAAPHSELHIDWEAPPGCPDAEVVRAHARALLRDTVQPVSAWGTIVASPDGGGFVLALTVTGVSGVEERELHDASCEALGEAAGLLIAVAADPALADPRLEIPPVDPPPPDPPPSEPTPRAKPATLEIAAPREPSPSPPPSRVRVRGVVRAEALGQFFRLLPNAAGVGVGGVVGVLLPRARAELRGRYFTPQAARYAEDPAVGGSFDLWSLGLSGCAEPRRRRLTFPLCGGFELGGVRGRSFGVPDSGRATSILADLTVDGAVVLAPRPRLGLYLGAQGVVALTRPSFHVRGLDPLFRVGPAALRLVAGFEVRFP